MSRVNVSRSNLSAIFADIQDTVLEAARDVLKEQAESYAEMVRTSINQGSPVPELAAEGASIPPNPISGSENSYGFRKKMDLGHTKGLLATGHYRDSIKATSLAGDDFGVQVGVDSSLSSSGYYPPTIDALSKRIQETGSTRSSRKRRRLQRSLRSKEHNPSLIEVAYRLEFGGQRGEGGNWQAKPRPLWGPLYRLVLAHSKYRGELRNKLRQRLRLRFRAIGTDRA